MGYLNEIIVGKWGKRTERAGWQLKSESGLGLQLLQIHISSSAAALNSVGIYGKIWVEDDNISEWLIRWCCSSAWTQGSRTVVYTWALLLSMPLLLVEAARRFDVSFPGLCLIVSVYKVLWCYKMLLRSEKINFQQGLQPSKWFGVACCSWCCSRQHLALMKWIRNQKILHETPNTFF